MLAARSAVLFLLVTSVLAAHQSKTQLHILARDITGAKIPGAQIQLRSTLGGEICSLVADGDGNATVEVVPGDYQVRVAYQAFCPENKLVAVSAHQQSVASKLVVQSCPGPCEQGCEVKVLGAPINPAQVNRSVIRFHLTDSQDRNVADAVVTVQPERAEKRLHGFSSQQGIVNLGLEIGTYKVEAEKAGYRIWHGFAVSDGPLEAIPVRLDSDPGFKSSGAGKTWQNPKDKSERPEMQRENVPGGQLELEVTNLSGFAVPGAFLQIDSDGGEDEYILHSDMKGRASTELQAGKFTLRALSAGYRVNRTNFEVRNGVRQVIKVGLIEGRTKNFFVAFDDPKTWLSPQYEQVGPLPLVSSETIPLPPRKLKSRHSWR